MKVGIVVLNWNGIQDSLNCLCSIYNRAEDDYYVAFVDNGSVDNSVGAIVEWASTNQIKYRFISENDSTTRAYEANGCREKHIAVIRLDKNLGYGGGNNIGIDYLMTLNVDYILILNNDVMVFPDTIRKMVDAFDGIKNIGVVGCDIINMHNGMQLPNGKRNYWLGAHFLVKFKKGIKGMQESNFIPGCAMLVKSCVFKAVGGFNEGYFLYADDIEFCYRVEKYGFKLMVNFDAKVLAKVSASSGGPRTPLYYYFVARNTMYFICKELRGVQRIFSILNFIGARALQIVCWAVHKQTGHIKAAIDGFADFARQVEGMGQAERYIAVLEENARKRSLISLWS